MHYNEDGNYIYQGEVLPSGDPLRVAAEQFAHDVESYLFNGHHPGYNNPAFLSWAVARFHATKQSSGNLANQYVHWDPQSNGHKAGLNPAQHNTWTPGTETDLGLRYPDAAFDHPGIDTSPTAPGPAELYEPEEVSNPAYASRSTHRTPVVVAPRENLKPEGGDA